MGLLIRDDDYDPSVRMTGFNRYKQLLSFFAGHWLKLNIITLVGLLPLAFFIILSIMAKSILLMLPLSFLGGMIAGPFISGLVDSIHRGLRDDTNNRWDNYKKGMRQNIKCSIIPGGVLGLVIGIYSFYFMMIYWGAIVLTKGTIAVIALSLFFAIDIFTLYWPQLVIFEMGLGTKMRNIILFTSKYLWKMLLTVLIQIAYWTFYILFAPITVIFLPFIGLWYIIFLSQFLIYDKLNLELHIEELHQE